MNALVTETNAILLDSARYSGRLRSKVMVSLACFGAVGSGISLPIICFLSFFAIIPVSLFAVFLESTMGVSLPRAIWVEAVSLSIITAISAILFGSIVFYIFLPGVIAAAFLTLLSCLIGNASDLLN
jgi:hypothetical protein